MAVFSEEKSATFPASRVRSQGGKKQQRTALGGWATLRLKAEREALLAHQPGSLRVHRLQFLRNVFGFWAYPGRDMYSGTAEAWAPYSSGEDSIVEARMQVAPVVLEIRAVRGVEKPAEAPVDPEFRYACGFWADVGTQTHLASTAGNIVEGVEVVQSVSDQQLPAEVVRYAVNMTDRPDLLLPWDI